MSVARQRVGEPEVYRGRLISVTFMGPDFLAHVDTDIEMPNFYLTPAAAVSAAQRYINDAEKAKEKK